MRLTLVIASVIFFALLAYARLLALTQDCDRSAPDPSCSTITAQSPVAAQSSVPPVLASAHPN